MGRSGWPGAGAARSSRRRRPHSRARDDPPHRQTVPDLLQHETGKYREDLNADAVAELVDILQQLLRLETIAALGRAHAGLLVFLAGDVGRHRIADVVSAVLADHQAASLRQPVEAEGGEEQVQQARMIGDLHVLHVELPVARKNLAVAAEQLHRRLHDAADLRHGLRPKILLDRWRLLAGGREHEPGQDLDSGLPRPMLVRLAIRRHAALAADAAAEGDAREFAGKVIGPVVIDADDLAGLAALLEAQERAAMRATVLEGVDRTVPVARHHHRHVAEVRRAKRLGPRPLRLQAQKCPGVAAEYARLLLGVKLAIGIDPVGDPGEPLGRPAALMDVHAFVSRRPRRPPQWAIAKAYSSFTLAALITLFQRSTSSRMQLAVSAGVPPTGSADRSSKRLRISGCLIASAMSALIRATIGSGGFGGATTAHPAADANPGSVSAIVGTSGRAAMRLAVRTAISLSWPLLTRAG